MAKYGMFNLNQIEAVFNKIGGEERVRMLLQDKLVITIKNVAQELKSILNVVKNSIHVGSVPSVKTADCFKKDFVCRDSDIDGWMAKKTPIVDSGSAICYELTEDGSTFLDMARVILDTGSEQSEEKIAKLLIEQGKTFSLKQVEDLHKRFVGGETEIGFNTNGYANLFFVHDEKSVFVLDVYLLSDGWRVDVNGLGSSYRWDAGSRLFSRN